MVVVDTSVWVDHLRPGDQQLADLLQAKRVLIHPFVIGELALGDLQPRDEILAMLQDLPRAVVATDDEVLDFIEQRELIAIGIGYVDAHILASVALTPSAKLLSRDKRMRAVADRLGFNLDSLH